MQKVLTMSQIRNMIGDMTNPRIAEELRMALARAQRSQRWLAEQTGISAATLSRKMRGDGSITLGEVLAICAALQVSATDIVARVEHPELGPTS